MNTEWNQDIYCLIGNPVSKSLSPIIHNNYYKIIRKNNIYLTFNIEEKDLDNVVKNFKALNIKGFNVTLPHKINIINYLDSISKEARILGAVNTVNNEKGKLVGYNTDGIGFIKSLELENIDIKGKTILILGAGGAANAISTSLAMEGTKKIIIGNRTLSKGKKLAIKLKNKFPKVLVEYDNLQLKKIEKGRINMIINCTSVGMYPNVNITPISLDGFSYNLIVYDIIYKPIKTKLLELAETRGYYTINGLSMLINQALFSQEIWLGKKDNNYAYNYNKIKRILETYVE